MARANQEKAARWQLHVTAYRTSGLTRKEYCRVNRLNLYQLDYWRKKLNRSPKAPSTRNENRFVPVRVHDETLPGSIINLQIGQITIEITAGFDPKHLKNVLQVLGAGC